jgi:predicted Fe-Mo cluster-binding NifX family protein
MLACIPTNGNAGLEDTVSDHFGSAGYFTLYNSETDELEVVENRNAHHDHGTCHPMNQLVKYRIDVVVCSGMGRRAIEALSTEGVKVYQSDSKIVRDVIEKIKANDLTEIDPAKACRGHGQQAGTSFVVSEGRGSGHGQGGCNRRGRGQGQGSGRSR